MPAGMVLDGVVDTTPVVVDVISGAGVVVGDGFLQENSFMRSKMVQSSVRPKSSFIIGTKSFFYLNLNFQVNDL